MSNGQYLVNCVFTVIAIVHSFAFFFLLGSFICRYIKDYISTDRQKLEKSEDYVYKKLHCMIKNILDVYLEKPLAGLLFFSLETLSAVWIQRP